MAPGVASLPSSATSFFQRDKVRDQQVTRPRLHNAERLVLEALHKRIQSINLETSGPGEDDAFFVADLGEVHRLHREWTRQLERVTPFFAVKCNPNQVVLRLLAALGTGFDCASITEIRTVLSMGVEPSRIIFANPCKIMSALKYAREQGVSKMTFDSAEELHKIKHIFPEAQLFLRIVACDPSALCQLSAKFGARIEATEKLLKLAKSLELDVVGVSFHVGSGGKDPTAFTRAVQDASIVLGQAEQLGFRIHTLDIGGGFSAGPLFAETAGIINAALDKYVSRDMRVIAEPGRYMVNSAFTAAATVIAKRESDPHGAESNNLKTTMLYINDGTYGSHYNSIVEVPAVPKVFRRGNSTILEDRWSIELAPIQEYSIWGPTCDSVDCVNPTCRLPGRLSVGDWLYYRGMGGWSFATLFRPVQSLTFVWLTRLALLPGSTASRLIAMFFTSAPSLLRQLFWQILTPYLASGSLRLLLPGQNRRGSEASSASTDIGCLAFENLEFRIRRGKIVASVSTNRVVLVPNIRTPQDHGNVMPCERTDEGA